MAVFTRFGSDVDDATARLLRRGECLTELLKQGKGEPLDVFDETAILLAFKLDAFYDVPKSEIRTAAKKLLAADMFNRTHELNHKVCAIGTTVLRALETASMSNGYIKPYEGWTSRFIFPPYEFTTADALVSNFQLPFSTMLMNACAFGGYDLVMKAYDVAVMYVEPPYARAIIW